MEILKSLVIENRLVIIYVLSSLTILGLIVGTITGTIFSVALSRKQKNQDLLRDLNKGSFGLGEGSFQKRDYKSLVEDMPDTLIAQAIGSHAIKTVNIYQDGRLSQGQYMSMISHISCWLRVDRDFVCITPKDEQCSYLGKEKVLCINPSMKLFWYHLNHNEERGKNTRALTLASNSLLDVFGDLDNIFKEETNGNR